MFYLNVNYADTVVRVVVVNMKRVIFLFIILYSNTALGWPKLEFPESATVEVVADNMQMNGYPMKTWVMKNKSSQQLTAAYFRKQWKRQSQLFHEQMFEGDYIVNSLQPPYLLTARISQSVDGVIAYIGVTEEADESRVKMGSKFPLPNGANVLSDIASNDVYKSGRVLVVSTSRSLSASYHFYRNHYLNRGWLEDSSLLDVSAGKAALILTKGANIVNLSFDTNNSQVFLVANQVFEG